MEKEIIDEKITAQDIKKAFRVGGAAAGLMLSSLFSNVYGQSQVKASHEFVKDMMGEFGEGTLDITAVFKEKFPAQYKTFTSKRGEGAKFILDTDKFDESSEFTALPVSIQQSIFLTYIFQAIKAGKMTDKKVDGEVIARIKYDFPQGKATQPLPPLEFEVDLGKSSFTQDKGRAERFRKAWIEAVKQGKGSFEFEGELIIVRFKDNSLPDKGEVELVKPEVRPKWSEKRGKPSIKVKKPIADR